jgi:hypothetical protein
VSAWVLPRSWLRAAAMGCSRSLAELRYWSIGLGQERSCKRE